MRDRIVIASLSMLVVLLAAVAFVYAFGTPQAPAEQAATTTAAGAPVPAAEPVPVTEAPAPGGKPPLAIEIPGCVCHSKDPKQVAAHATYRINECARCHAGGMPDMGGGD